MYFSGSKSVKYENGVVTSNVPEEGHLKNVDTNSQPQSGTLQWSVSISLIYPYNITYIFNLQYFICPYIESFFSLFLFYFHVSFSPI